MREPTRVAVLISGRGSNMKAIVEQASGYEVVLVASNKPLAPGLAWARDRAIPTWTWDSRGVDKTRRHGEHDIAEADHSSLAVGEGALVHHLAQQRVDVGMGLLDLVEEHDRIGAATYGFGELATLLVADVPRRRADQAGDGLTL